MTREQIRAAALALASKLTGYAEGEIEFEAEEHPEEGIALDFAAIYSLALASYEAGRNSKDG